MTLRAGHYRAIQLFYDDGSPVLGPGNREVWVTRCGAELLGTRTDGGDATKNIATFLGIRRKTVAPSGPLTPVTSPGDVGTPGSGFEPGQGQIQGDGEGSLLTVGGGKLIVPEDKEIWVVKPCTRTPGPPPGPFPPGAHIATPLHATHDHGSGPLAVYADGCVECEAPRRYRCLTGTCVEDANGEYASLDECEQFCQRPPTPLCGFNGYPAPTYWLVDLGEYTCDIVFPPPPPNCRLLRRFQLLDVLEFRLGNSCAWRNSAQSPNLSIRLAMQGASLTVTSQVGQGTTTWATNTFSGYGRQTLQRTGTNPLCPNSPLTITAEPL